jgi:hypothetical protein
MKKWKKHNKQLLKIKLEDTDGDYNVGKVIRTSLYE